MACALTLAACATVPLVDENKLLADAKGSEPITVYGTRGPLSAKQSRAVLAHLDAQVPDAGAFERHLAVEQIVAESRLFTGTRVQVLRDGQETFPAIFAAIRGAQRYLLLEYYIFEDVTWDGQSLSDLLVEKARAGVHICIIYDGIGSLTLHSGFFDKLSSAGIELLEFNPPAPWKARAFYSLNSRDHRKLLVADGTLAIVGGVNMSSSYESGPGASGGSAAGTADSNAHDTPEVWHDMDAEISGPIVPEFEALFRGHWKEEHGPPLNIDFGTERPPAAGSELARIISSNPRRLRRRYYATVLSAIRNAESSIWIMAAYCVPTHQEKEGLMAAARRGVDVRLLLPSHSDSGPALEVQHSHYADLLKAGVKIYEREDGILHSKTMVVDGVWSIIGSSNFDHRSVLFNDEVDVVVLGKQTGSALEQEFNADLGHAQAIDPVAWSHRSVLLQWKEDFWRLWEKLL